MKLTAMGQKAAATLSIIALVGILVGVMDTRHASAGDVEQLYDVVVDGQIADMEFRLAEVEIQIAILDARETLTEIERVTLSTLRSRRERYLRQLDSILALKAAPP